MLGKYIENNNVLEGEALLALQYLMHRSVKVFTIRENAIFASFYRLEHPNKLLHSIFEILYEDDIIGDDAFLSWEINSDPAKQVSYLGHLSSFRLSFVFSGGQRSCLKVLHTVFNFHQGGGGGQ